jgi:hypothetical protein
VGPLFLIEEREKFAKGSGELGMLQVAARLLVSAAPPSVDLAVKFDQF